MKINRFLLNGLVEFDYTNSDQKALPENTDSRSVDPPTPGPRASFTLYGPPQNKMINRDMAYF